jgi:hypothetical protein
MKHLQPQRNSRCRIRQTQREPSQKKKLNPPKKNLKLELDGDVTEDNNEKKIIFLKKIDEKINNLPPERDG